MKVEQLSIFLENKSGRLSEVTRALAEVGVNIRALSIADTADFGILRLIVDNIEVATDALRARQFTVSRTEVAAVEVPDKPGGMSRILELLERESINVEYMYAFVERRGGCAIIVFRLDDMDRAVTVLSGSGLTLLDGSAVYSI